MLYYPTAARSVAGPRLFAAAARTEDSVLLPAFQTFAPNTLAVEAAHYLESKKTGPALATPVKDTLDTFFFETSSKDEADFLSV